MADDADIDRDELVKREESLKKREEKIKKKRERELKAKEAEIRKKQLTDMVRREREEVEDHTGGATGEASPNEPAEGETEQNERDEERDEDDTLASDDEPARPDDAPEELAAERDRLEDLLAGLEDRFDDEDVDERTYRILADVYENMLIEVDVGIKRWREKK